MKRKYLIITLIFIMCMSIGAASIAGMEELKEDSVNFTEELVDIKITNENIEIQHNGLSKFIDIIGIYKNGETRNLNKEVRFDTEDQEIAIAVEGRILARGKGKTEISVSIGEVKKVIKVEVIEDVDLKTMMRDIAKKETVSSKSLTTAEREAMITIASGMYNVSWTPTQNLTGYNNYWTYTSSSTYNIPYSRTVYQKDEAGFEAVVDDNDFYDYYVRDSIVMPKYGNDCSAFVSYAWEVTRETTASFIAAIGVDYPKVGSYNKTNLTYTDLMNSYPSMLAGDAVVHSGHVILIGQNYYTCAFCYEQVGPEIDITVWYYTNLANANYMPFSRE